MPWRDEIVSNPMIGSAHGGILSALIDLTGLYTINALGGSARATADMRVDFHRPATSGPLVRAIGRVIKLGRAAKRRRKPDRRCRRSNGCKWRGAYVG
jgi:uncharacterized protein (TIGR00369 family)